MTRLTIQLAEDRTVWRPGEELRGSAAWEGDTPAAAELRLFWYTEGRGDQDVELVQTQRFDHAAPNDRQAFAFRLPAGPYSFSGQLIQLRWALELVMQPGGESTRCGFVLSASRREIQLGHLDEAETNPTQI